MNRDILAAAAVSLLVHSTLAWMGRGHAERQVALAAPNTPITPFILPTIPPEPDPDDVSDSHAGASGGPEIPSLPDVPVDRPTSPVAILADPSPPPIHPDPIGIIPNVPVSPDGPGGPGGPNRPFDPGVLDRQPIPTVRPQPAYPYEMKHEGVEGTVVVDFVVDAQGNVLRPRAIEGLHPEFDQAAVEGVRRWHFRPGMKGGRAVATHMQIPIVFSLGSGE